MTDPQQKYQRLQYYTYDVFATELYMGNQLAIVHVPPSATLPQAARQANAKELNYSETVILSLPVDDTSTDVPTFTVQIFLTDDEVPIAGHPVIGTATHIFTRLLPPGTTRAALDTKAGLCHISLDPDGRVSAAIPHDLHFHENKIDPSALNKQQPGLQDWAAVAKCDTVSLVRGMNFVCVRLPSLEALGAVKLFSPPLDGTVLDAGWHHGFTGMMFYVLLDEGLTSEGPTRVRTRMVEGMFEDAATGSASCALASLLALGERAREFELTQGVEMGRRSEIGVRVEVEGGKVGRVSLSGRAVEVMQGSLRAPGQG